uniref:Transposase Tc1-like domain-containing protein n=1 Tax=Daphnia galeata TaxID=27404 RepID=A0A8J2RLJ7_9CRUS|nr:unnamed protein product [Daphnia galeata]
MNGRVACKKPLLRKVNIQKRLKFAKEHVHWTTKQWEKAVPSGLNLLGEGFIFQEDNETKHSSNLCHSYFDKKKKLGVLKRMVWPPQSPDLNPIEQDLDFVKSR